MRISNNGSVDQLSQVSQQQTQNAKSTPQQPQQAQTAFNTARTGTDARATSRTAENGIGSSLLSRTLHNTASQSSFQSILKNLSALLHSGSSSTKGKSLRDKVQSAADPDDKGVHGAGPSSGANGGPQLVKNPGKILTKPGIDNIYLGSYYNTTQGKSDTSHQDAAAKAWVTSGNEAVLKQYGVGTGTFNGSHVVVPSKTPRTYTASQVEALVKQQIAAGKSPVGDQIIHTVYLPPGTVLKDGSATSQQGLGGFHGSYTDSKTGKEVYYAVIAYSKGSNGIDFNGNPQDNNSIVASHEWSEAATDPDVGLVNRTGNGNKLGWYDNNFGEVGDIPINISNDPNLRDVWGKEGGFAFQKEWSNKDNRPMLTTTTA